MKQQPNASLVQPKRPLLIGFCGIDGSGKSTQIQNLRVALTAHGMSTRLCSFWDDVAVGCRYRESFVHRIYKSEPGIGAPGKPVQRRDKNVSRWYLSLLRHGLYFADAVHLAWVVARARRASVSVVIMDRYIYDELANLPLHNRLTQAYVRLIELIVPRPDIAYLLDADPVAARERKPEYPVDFMHRCRRAYKDLVVLLGTMTMIPALPLREASQRVLDTFWLMVQQKARMPGTQIAPKPQKLDSAEAA